MAFTCGFFNSQNGDRKYNAEQMASIFDGLIKDGVYDTVGEIFAVTPGTGMQVLVGSGRAWFDHTWNNNDASYPLAITAADVSLPRYDAVVLETNHSDTVRTNRLRVLTGTPASNPVKPTMTSSANVKQHPLAYIKVTAGATAITQSMIQVVVGTSECPFVTGIIDTAEIDALFQQWNGEFNEWFENLKAQLSDNVVANLQAQIDQKVAKADVATKADIEAGTSTTKWVTPKGLREAGVDGSEVGRIVESYATPGDNYLPLNGQVVDLEEYPNLFDSIPGAFYPSDSILPDLAGFEMHFIYFIPTNKNIGLALVNSVNNSREFYIYTTIDGGGTWVDQNVSPRVYSLNEKGTVIQWIPYLKTFVIATYSENFNTFLYFYSFNAETNVLTFSGSVNTGSSVQLYCITDIVDDPSRNRFLIIGANSNSYSSNYIMIKSVPYLTYKDTSTYVGLFSLYLSGGVGDNRGYIVNDRLLLYGVGNKTNSSNKTSYNIYILSLIDNSEITSTYYSFESANPNSIGSNFQGHQRPIKYNNKYYLFTTITNGLVAFMIDESLSTISRKDIALTGVPNVDKMTPQVMVGEYFYIFQKGMTIRLHHQYLDGLSNKISIVLNASFNIQYIYMYRYELYPEYFQNGDFIAMRYKNLSIRGVNSLPNELNKWVKGA